jgi:hypothetical protein
MTNDSFFALVVSGIIALGFGTALLLAGYQFFIVLLPIFGFFFGFALGAETIQALLGGAFLATVTSWVVGFIVAAAFAVLSYVFYFVAVGLIGGALGYALAVGLLEAIGVNFGFLVWLVGIVVGVVFAVAVLLLNIQKWVVIVATALLGAGVIVSTFLFLTGKLTDAQLTQDPVRVALQASPFWTIAFIVLAVGGIVLQYVMTRQLEIETYNRLSAPSNGDSQPSAP